MPAHDHERCWVCTLVAWRVRYLDPWLPVLRGRVVHQADADRHKLEAEIARLRGELDRALGEITERDRAADTLHSHWQQTRDDLADRHARLRGRLATLEWAGRTADGRPCCPACTAPQEQNRPVGGTDHKLLCWLDVELDLTRAAAPRPGRGV